MIKIPEIDQRGNIVQFSLLAFLFIGIICTIFLIRSSQPQLTKTQAHETNTLYPKIGIKDIDSTGTIINLELISHRGLPKPSATPQEEPTESLPPNPKDKEDIAPTPVPSPTEEPVYTLKYLIGYSTKTSTSPYYTTEEINYVSVPTEAQYQLPANIKPESVTTIWVRFIDSNGKYDDRFIDLSPKYLPYIIPEQGYENIYPYPNQVCDERNENCSY